MTLLVAASVLMSSLGVGAGASGVQQPEATGPSSFAAVAATAELRGRSHQPKRVVAGRSRVVRAAGHRLAGIASWYCRSGYSRCSSGFEAGGAYAAAGPALRAALGNWRGRLVYVNGVPTRLIDWCACPGGRLLDLYGSLFARLSSLSAGLLRVSVTWN